VAGVIRLPGDKSISHRYAMLASLAEGQSEITNYSTGADCASTLDCMRALGVAVSREGNLVTVHGVGLGGLKPAGRELDAGNSGSTIRMLSGILAGQPFETQIGGDESLSRRPMQRVMTPLALMGAQIEARDGNFPPLKIAGGKLRAIDYRSPVASAQVKTAVLFGGMFAAGVTTVQEPVLTRNHSEIALKQLGADVRIDGLVVSLQGGPRLRAQPLVVPSDISSATFFIAAALILPGSDLVIDGVGLNPTRAALLDVLRSMGGSIEILDLENQDTEPIGRLRIRGPQSGAGCTLRGGVIEGAATAEVIDEIPMLAVLGAVSREGLAIRNAAELRVKETDRIATVAENLGRLGVAVEVTEDSMTIPGRQTFRPAALDSFGDHRIAMAFAIAALAADGESSMENAESASVSFPEFYGVLDEITA
jgi:3-phosphoshikimate 1-carboxyvinyltransferase